MPSGPMHSQLQPDSARDVKAIVMAVSAMFEGEFTIDWLVELTALKGFQILPVLQSDVEAGKLNSPSPGIYSFSRKSDREQWRERSSFEERKKLHARISELLIRDLPEDGEKTIRIANHLLHIDDNDEKACGVLSAAGDLHRKSYRHEQAFQCYIKALNDLKNRPSENADRLFTATAINYSKISTARHDTNRVLEILYEALQRASKREFLPARALLEMHIAKNEWLRTRYDDAMNHFEQGWALTMQLDDPQIHRAVSAFGTFFLYWQGRFREAVDSHEKSMSAVEQYPQGGFPLLGTITVGYCYAQVGQYTQGLGMLDAIRAQCLERGDLYLEAQALGNMGEILLDIRRVDEALHYLEQAVKSAVKSHNDWVWMVSQVVLAFAYFLKGEKRRTALHLREFIKHAEKSKAVVHPYPYLLAICWAMEEGRLKKIEGLSLETEIKRMADSTSIFMKGLAYRYQALLYRRQGESPEKCIQAHEKSIDFLLESGHQLELARSRLELARLHLSLGEEDKAREITVLASQVLSSFNEDLISDDLRGLIDRPRSGEHLLKEILELGRQVVGIRDYKDLVNRIISAVNRLTGAERGAIFLVETDRNGERKLELSASKNLTLEQVKHPYFKASMKMIEEAAGTGKGGILDAGREDDSALLTEGVIRSMVCVPMVLQKKVVGVLYHDNRLLSSAFKESDLDTLAYFSAMAAFALDNARAYEEINRLNRKLSLEKEYFEEEHLSHLHFDEIVGKSPAVKKLVEQIEQVASTEATVLITGETGVGKELVARAIHRLSPRQNKPFISVQLSSLPENLIPSELFGHEKGAFTGANTRRIGRFELADGASLFLDEIGEISADIQVRLLRTLQTRQFERVGGVVTQTSDFRLIAATNRDLEEEIGKGTFRADLYYRLNVFPVYVPPLRERKEDIPLLADHFLKIYANKLGKSIGSLQDRELDMLMQYDWPGNVRELENVIERGAILSTGRRFRMPELDLLHGKPSHGLQGGCSLADNEKRHIIWALEKTDWKVRGKGGAAELLDVHPSTLSFRMKKHNIKRPEDMPQKRARR